MSARRIEKAISVLEESDKSFSRARRLFFVLAATRLFLSGVEVSVIMPSVWLYLQSMGGSPSFMGIVESAHGIGAMVSLGLVGLVYDRFKKGREIIIVMNFLQIAGNLIYSIPASKWCALLGRFVCGLGDSFMACYLGELMYTVRSKRRTATLFFVTAGRLVGITFGPLINFGIVRVKFRVGDWTIDKRNFAGILMALLWALLQVSSFFFLQNSSTNVLDYVERSKGLSGLPDCGEIDDTESELFMLDPKNSVSIKDEAESAGKTQSIRESHSAIKPSLVVFLSLEFLALTFVEFVMWTTHQIFRVLLPLITENDLHFSQEYVGIFYIAGGAETIIVIILVYYLHKRLPFRDTYLVLIALTFIACSQLCLVLEYNLKALASRVMLLSLAVVFTSAFAPLCLVASKELIGKYVPARSQGAFHGGYLSAVRLSSVIGPLLGGIAYHNRTHSGIAMLTCTSVGFLLFALAMRRFHRHREELEQI